jgi:UDP-N-acetylglucosamine--N-acetylmuramyl-(pentapeptide) pyrophosphoryl-undecaprenol N-acetylglucosamine transferase
VARYLISCGGTGGHLAPGIALAEALAAAGDEPVLLISRKQVDARLSAKYPALRFERMPGTGFAWRPDRFVRCAWTQLQAVWFCWRLLGGGRTRAAVGFGGFTSAPLVVAAWIRGVPCALHESNRVPGRAIRLLGRLARRVYLPPGVGLETVAASVVKAAPMPVRREIAPHDAAVARRELGLDPGRPVVVVLGGSQGAAPLNAWARGEVAALAKAGLQLYCVTGPGQEQERSLTHAGAAGEPVTAVFTPFTDRMAVVLSAADLVVSRAGAGTIAELIRCGAPALLIPYPQAADDHQRANARWLAEQGAARVVEQTQVGTLTAEVLAAMADDTRRAQWRAALARLRSEDPLTFMLADLATLGRKEGA